MQAYLEVYRETGSGQASLTWTNPGFGLQSAPATARPFTLPTSAARRHAPSRPVSNTFGCRGIYARGLTQATGQGRTAWPARLLYYFEVLLHDALGLVDRERPLHAGNNIGAERLDD